MRPERVFEETCRQRPQRPALQAQGEMLNAGDIEHYGFGSITFRYFAAAPNLSAGG
jgi:hypothetical protein